MPIIETQQLSKSFKVHTNSPANSLTGRIRRLFRDARTEIRALDSVSFKVERGEAVAYLGPNGAGKSTTIKLLCGILTPSVGTACVLGYTPWKERKSLVRHIGVVFGQRSQLLWDLPVKESFRFLATIYGLSKAEQHTNTRFISDLMDLDELLNKPVRELSLGQRVRCEVGAALLHQPEILLLDEPTIGLDLLVKDRVREGLRYLRKELGVTILLASHDFGDVEAICDRAILINNGLLRYDGGLEKLRSLTGPARTIEFTLEQSTPNLDLVLGGGPEVESEVTEDKLVIKFDSSKVTAQKIIAAVTASNGVTDFKIIEPRLEDAVRELYINPDLKELPKA
ncbi:MAG TPA: hypothetical protein DCY85_12670 [Firmicutes bacterium]|nr:hypothetical protein [Bacillota bacterium]HCT37597.1 hypothetical protein [Bacillota bacterium]